MGWWSRCLAGMTRTHAVAVLAIGVVVPLASHVLGSGELAYAMYARTSEYRLDVFAVNEGTLRHRVAPTELARGARASVIPLLAGADHWRTTPRVGDLRSTLPKLAEHACAVAAAPGTVAIEIVLEERAREGEPIRTSRATATCAP